MIIYLDTSALVKRYFRESYSDEVISKWKSATQIVTSFVTYAETIASMYRKKREAEIPDTLLKVSLDSFYHDWDSFIRVKVDDRLKIYIDRVLEKYPLRGFDAIHLASALAIKESLHRDLLFICFDDRLLWAARSEQLATFPPADYPSQTPM